MHRLTSVHIKGEAIVRFNSGACRTTGSHCHWVRVFCGRTARLEALRSVRSNRGWISTGRCDLALRQWAIQPSDLVPSLCTRVLEGLQRPTIVVATVKEPN